jgi:hypothetical protein
MATDTSTIRAGAEIFTLINVFCVAPRFLRNRFSAASCGWERAAEDMRRSRSTATLQRNRMPVQLVVVSLEL